MTSQKDLEAALDAARPTGGSFTFDEVEALLLRHSATAEHVDALRAALVASGDEAKELRRRLSEAERDLTVMRTSSWWRLGAPLRSTADLVKRLTHRGTA